MKRPETPSDTERYALTEESVLLRIEQLKMGLLQLTDACYPATPDSLGVLPEAKLHTRNPIG